MKKLLLRSWFSAILVVAYLGLFHAWLMLPRSAVIASGLAGTAALAGLLLEAIHGRYFLSLWDALAHASVLVDLLLEAITISEHTSFGFYFCALGFGVVLIGYREYLFRRRSDLRSSIEPVPRS